MKPAVLGGPVTKKTYRTIIRGLPGGWRLTAIKRLPNKANDLLVCFAGEHYRISIGRYALQQKFDAMNRVWNKYQLEMATLSASFYIRMKMGERSFFEKILPMRYTDPAKQAAKDREEAQRDAAVKKAKREFDIEMKRLEAEMHTHQVKTITRWSQLGVCLS
ncbi:MAG: hypothetical protein WC869_01305 [Phycisphaerae bacterium]|jgi:hypothetical protein